jgi:hypothetical protein
MRAASGAGRGQLPEALPACSCSSATIRATPDPERRRCYNRVDPPKFAGETGAKGKKVDE